VQVLCARAHTPLYTHPRQKSINDAKVGEACIDRIATDLLLYIGTLLFFFVFVCYCFQPIVLWTVELMVAASTTNATAMNFGLVRLAMFVCIKTMVVLCCLLVCLDIDISIVVVILSLSLCVCHGYYL
jgi:hypothetical protein